jgi:chromatin structure-remodeling complex subunit RSC9
MAVTFEETLTVRDERNPNLPPQAAGIPLSAALVLRNMARNVVKTEAEEELLKKQEKTGETGGWNETLFRPILPRLFEILAENRALVCHSRPRPTVNASVLTHLAESLHCITS